MKTKRLFILLIVAVMILCTVFGAEAHPFTDYPAEHWGSLYINWAYSQGLMNGISADAFSPEAPTNRAMLIKELYGAHPTVNSFHHQAVARLGRGFRAIAFAEDGTVEAIQHQSLPILGVQFHPERMANGAPIFEWFLSQIRLQK